MIAGTRYLKLRPKAPWVRGAKEALADARARFEKHPFHKSIPGDRRAGNAFQYYAGVYVTKQNGCPSGSIMTVHRSECCVSATFAPQATAWATA